MPGHGTNHAASHATNHDDGGYRLSVPTAAPGLTPPSRRRKPPAGVPTMDPYVQALRRDHRPRASSESPFLPLGMPRWPSGPPTEAGGLTSLEDEDDELAAAAPAGLLGRASLMDAPILDSLGAALGRLRDAAAAPLAALRAATGALGGPSTTPAAGAPAGDPYRLLAWLAVAAVAWHLASGLANAVLVAAGIVVAASLVARR